MLLLVVVFQGAYSRSVATKAILTTGLEGVQEFSETEGEKYGKMFEFNGIFGEKKVIFS